MDEVTDHRQAQSGTAEPARGRRVHLIEALEDPLELVRLDPDAVIANPEHQLVTVGTRAQLRPVWLRYNILAKSVPETPAIIEHVSLIYGIDARGRIRVGYPASPLKTSWIEHDAPILARAK